MREMAINRICAMVLVASSILSLVGCGADTGKSTETKPASIQVTEPVTTSAETGSAETIAIPTETIKSGETTVPTEPLTEPTVPPTTQPEENKDEFELSQQQKNSFSMLYYLAITAEEIRISKNNRLILEDIYTDLLNDINPGAIDEITQDHLENLRDIIKDYIDISVKRDRLQYIHNQDKAVSMRNAVPNPLAVLSMSQSLNWKKLAMTSVFTVVDSFNNYKRADEAADRKFLMSGWELDDKETAAIQKNRERAFNYMVDMVREYNLDGKLTLNEENIETFAKICAIESIPQKIHRLESEQETYKLLGNYWLELADCYFETERYRECIECVDCYNELSTGIYRKDYNYVQILPKAIVAAQNIYSGDLYVSRIADFADAILENTTTEEWSLRYFAAQVYLDLYSRTNDREYLQEAYNIAFDNVTILIDEQRRQNATYLDELHLLEVEEPAYNSINKSENKEAKAKYKEEKKRVKAYNAEQEEIRKTELLPVYEPLVLSCDLLFALAEKTNISNAEKQEIEAILQTEKNGVFLSKPINAYYSFNKPEIEAHIEFGKDEMIIPADILSAGVKIIAEIDDNGTITEIDDFLVKKVERASDSLADFRAYVVSEALSDYAWTKDSEVTVRIMNVSEDAPLLFHFKVSEFKDRKLIGDKVVFKEG